LAAIRCLTMLFALKRKIHKPTADKVKCLSIYADNMLL
jgi:hypothetical protein